MGSWDRFRAIFLYKMNVCSKTNHSAAHPGGNWSAAVAIYKSQRWKIKVEDIQRYSRIYTPVCHLATSSRRNTKHVAAKQHHPSMFLATCYSKYSESLGNKSVASKHYIKILRLPDSSDQSSECWGGWTRPRLRLPTCYLAMFRALSEIHVLGRLVDFFELTIAIGPFSCRCHTALHARCFIIKASSWFGPWLLPSIPPISYLQS